LQKRPEMRMVLGGGSFGHFSSGEAKRQLAAVRAAILKSGSRRLPGC
jgi:hypothetical protein